MESEVERMLRAQREFQRIKGTPAPLPPAPPPSANPGQLKIVAIGLGALIVLALLFDQGQRIIDPAGYTARHEAQTKRIEAERLAREAKSAGDKPVSLASNSSDQVSPKGKYLEQLDREIASLEKISPLKQSEVATKNDVVMGTALIGAWSKVYFEGKIFDLSSAENKRLEKFGNLLSKTQKQRFPVLRKAQAEIFKDSLWENDIEAAAIGRGLRFTGGMFAANRNIATAFSAVKDTAQLLRYDRVTFEWYRGSENTYYDLKPLPDEAIAELTDYGWVDK
jgi:hypothetical protein